MMMIILLVSTSMYYIHLVWPRLSYSCSCVSYSYSCVSYSYSCQHVNIIQSWRGPSRRIRAAWSLFLFYSVFHSISILCLLCRKKYKNKYNPSKKYGTGTDVSRRVWTPVEENWVDADVPCGRTPLSGQRNPCQNLRERAKV